MIGAATLRAGLAAPLGVALVVTAVAGTSLMLLAAGDDGGGLAEAARPATGWNSLAWAALFLGSWTLMTGAMMLPSSLPFLQAAHRLGGAQASAIAGVAFTVVWLGVGVLLWAALWQAGGLLAGLPPGGAEQLAGASLIVAAAYQASPLAVTCRRACARPFAILARHWHTPASHRQDAFAAGLHYGVSCVGCCLPMIVLMLVVGMHDLTWILGLALLMAIQKHAVWGERIVLPTAAALAMTGVAIGVGWWSVPLHTLRALCGA